MGSSGTGNDPEEDFGLADLGVEGEISKVGSERELASTAKGETVHCRDRRLLQSLENPNRFDQPRGREIPASSVHHRFETFDVCAGGEVRLAGDHHGPDRWIGAHLEGLAQLGGELFVHGVDGRPIEPDQCDCPVDCQFNMFHAARLTRSYEVTPGRSLKLGWSSAGIGTTLILASTTTTPWPG